MKLVLLQGRIKHLRLLLSLKKTREEIFPQAKFFLSIVNLL